MAENDRHLASDGTWARYLLFQSPEWLLLGAALYALHRWADVPLWAAGAALTLWLVKDLVLYRYVRRAYEGRPHVPGEELMGASGVAVEPLEPSGYVRVGGELWLAHASDRSARVAKDEKIRVKDVRGHALVVEAEVAGNASSRR